MTTPAEPEKRYITTLNNVCDGCECCKRDGNYEEECCILGKIRQHPYPTNNQSGDLIMPNAFDLKRGLACWGYYYRDDMVSPECIRDCEFKQSCIIVSKMLSKKDTPERCPHWECIEHSDGVEWCCNKKAKIPNGKDLKAIENYIYSSMDHTPEWEKAEKAYQNILSSRTQDTPAQQRIADAIFRSVRPQVLYFALLMEGKLRKHDADRGSRGWIGYTGYKQQQELFDHLKTEVNDELMPIVYRMPFWEPIGKDDECTDVGNMAMMIQTAGLDDVKIAPLIAERAIALLREELL